MIRCCMLLDITNLKDCKKLHTLLALRKYCYTDVKVQKKKFFFVKIITILGNNTFECLPRTYM